MTAAETAAVGASLLVAAVAVFQLALALGLPLGDATWGGRAPTSNGSLTTSFRPVAAVSAVVLLGIAWLVLLGQAWSARARSATRSSRGRHGRCSACWSSTPSRTSRRLTPWSAGSWDRSPLVTVVLIAVVVFAPDQARDTTETATGYAVPR